MPSCLPSPPAEGSTLRAAEFAPEWTAAWCAAQQQVEPDNALPPQALRDSTLRQIVRLRHGGSCWRVRVSNLFGDRPLRLGAGQLALAQSPGRPEVDAAHSAALLFSGQSGAVIGPGQALVSDPVALALADGADLAVSLHLIDAPAQQTGHPGSRATSFFASGEQCAAPTLDPAAPVQHWYLLSDVEVQAMPGTPVLVAIGDSITDGRGSTTDGNDRWTDLLAERVRAGQGGATPPPHRPPLVVLNAALGGNRLLRDGIGPSLRTRFERDVLQRAGVSHALLHIGVNDLGTWREPGGGSAGGRTALLVALQTAFAELAELARRRGVVIIGSTVAPCLGNAGYQPDADDEAARQALNHWIRESGVFDAVADFDLALRDPAEPSCMHPLLHCGDLLHPSPAGMRALAHAVPWPLPGVVSGGVPGRVPGQLAGRSGMA